ncbi:S9 family peptidase [Bacteroides sp. 519]|uniref:alpha/beta hydrolase family protein n=1 Tax=Bacteroides sp. 519 TaxID=2302937 RepID=UPI0013D193C1|nr:hypothetical protein [Bacteroides sp. 519]NDV60365.1 hypothetical protein [Bacteroides sp. 519]
MKRFALYLMLVGLLVISCSDDDTPDSGTTVEYDYLIEASYTVTAQPKLLAAALEKYGYGEFAPLLKSKVNLYKVTYQTEYNGKKINASGALMVSEELNPDFPTVIYHHGTLSKDEAPSQSLNGILNFSLEVFLGISLASINNCAVLLPDYIGYGASADVVHPYLHDASLGQASFDFARACAEITNDKLESDWLNTDLFITGYSEGGYAALSLQKKIQETAQSGFTINKVLAGSGPYDQYALSKEFFAKEETQDLHTISSYLWVLDMYKRNYNYSKGFSDIFSTKDDALLKATNYDLGYFNPEKLELNTDPQLLFKESFLTNVQNESDKELISILKENSYTNFVPADSLIFVYGTNDNWVYPVCTETTYAAMKQKECKVKAYPMPGGDHATTLPYYLQLLLGRLHNI